MIGRLRGKLLVKQAPDLILDVGGVGYEISAPMTTFYRLPEVGAEVTLHTHLLVREDAQLLYGFISETDKLLFRTLIKVSGVGAKLALALLSGLSAEEIAATVQRNDVARLTAVPGIGKKTAERLLIELRDRLDDWSTVKELPQSGQEAAISPSHALKDAISALIALGYKPPEASRLVSGVDTQGQSSEDIIRLALKSVTV
ncbi:MAG: Holliday junction branch migration protein RuvA [Gammaproteobacteria bacterium]|nr:Holliday junction branch migration protein RuvA [Gammaproteobacteria bacterium]MDH5803051.1 Holliday junction branch migration protein RuvA [Gammaproteobacteria bacterium]